ncbi:MAG TPA: PAS domain-containing sensor histidine kinase [Gemmatimonadaceae bacterium]|nr:PAS domain-containing sensor histidine kinase [Gemmatimonadaceae bacterium]
MAAAALDGLDDACLVVAPDWIITYANDAFARLRGTADDRAIGESLWTAFPPLSHPGAATLLRAAMADGRRRGCRIPMTGHPAAIHEMRVAGIAAGLCIQLRDVTATVRSEQELAARIEENVSLREVARVLAAEVDLAPLLDVICREAMVQCDAAGASIGQIEGSEVVVVAGAGIGQRARGFRFPVAGSLTERVVARREPLRSADYTREHPTLAHAIDGYAAHRMLGAPLIAHQEVLGVLMFARRAGAPPFAEREMRRAQAIADHAALAMWKTRLLEQLQKANRAKGEFMAVMSHELRTPLTALTGYQELLQDEVFGPLSEQQRGALDRMRSSTELLTVIIDEILTFSRLDAGEVTPRLEHIAGQRIVAAAAAVVEPLAREKGLELLLDVPDEAVVLRTDMEMVRRILVNLGANAVKFTERGTVTIELAADGGNVSLAVRDTGIGIAAADLPRLFQPFTQLESGFTRRYGGTGLGLYISRRLAALLGGSVDVASTPGEGSEFTLRLPKER